MKKKIEQLLSGKFRYEQPRLLFSKEKLSITLEAGETVTLNCTYSPADANVLFGLLAPDGGYYYFDVTGGNIQETVKVNMRGAYTLHIINNSDTLVTVMGSVSY